MKDELFKHKFAYVFLVIGLVFFVMVFLGVWPNKLLQRGVISLMSLYYFLWGMFTHISNKTLSRRIIFEYASIALLGGVILGALTL